MDPTARLSCDQSCDYGQMNDWPPGVSTAPEKLRASIHILQSPDCRFQKPIRFLRQSNNDGFSNTFPFSHADLTVLALINHALRFDFLSADASHSVAA